MSGFRPLVAGVCIAALTIAACGLVAEDQPNQAGTFGRSITASTTTGVNELPVPAVPSDQTGETEPEPAGRNTTTTTGSSNPLASGDESEPPVARPSWLGTRTLPTKPDGIVVPQTTPPELVDRRLPTVDTLPPPADKLNFLSTIEPLTDEVLARSTWEEGCPVEPEELRHLTMSFVGFDGLTHTGEMVVNRAVADDIVSVFEQLFLARYPIEEMRLVTDADLDAPPTGDGNNTTSFVCRPVTGGTRFSQHAYGLAIDINPFLNPYQRGTVVLPELATSYLDRSADQPGLITEGDVVVSGFDAIGWHWGGRWNSLKDYQHFSLNNS